MSPECANCGGFVTEDYIRVRMPADECLCCPFCPDATWDPIKNEVRDARSTTRQHMRYGQDSDGDIAKYGGGDDD